MIPAAPSALARRLLDRRELISLERARVFLVSRLRARQPLGAAEYLTFAAIGEEGREAHKEATRLVAEQCAIYRMTFPLQYRESDTPVYSTARLHEFYRLVNEKLFPLDTAPLGDPRYFWPFIPVRGTQQHDWEAGCCPFAALQTVFKLALALSGRRAGAWRELGLGKEPAAPPAAVGWSLFVHSCMVSGTPLRYLPLAFHLTCYRTGNLWLDLPNDEPTYGIRWSAESMASLLKLRLQAKQINLNVLECDRWLDADPQARIATAAAIWNRAQAMEAANG